MAADVISLKLGINIVNMDSMRERYVHPRGAWFPRHDSGKAAGHAYPHRFPNLLPFRRDGTGTNLAEQSRQVRNLSR